jgi:aspartyl-tRNA(Asn)/glutamyl-tRNA(Gln) amidotransferase subunit A
VQSALSNQLTTCVDITNSYLQKIEEQDHLNAFIQVFAEEALEKALSVDKKLKAGRAGKLAGMVIGIKDNLCYKGHQVSASSRILDGFESLFSATVIERLLAEDAVIIGRLNCDEFAMGSANENSIYGAVKKPFRYL